MSEIPQVPSLDGSLRVIPDMVDFHALHNPDRPWAIFPSPSGTETIAITFKEFADATHRIAHALRPLPTLPAEQADVRKPDVVAILALCDTILYTVLLAGMVRAGLVVSV